MDSKTFRNEGYNLIDWIADYLDHAEDFPVLSRSQPGTIHDALPAAAPAHAEPFDQVMADFEKLILPGVTHWNHPRFFAYFPANNSAPSILGELLSAGLGVNAMLWQTSPAATELEQRMMEWLDDLIDLPAGFHGVIQDTASTATLCALLCAREKSTGYEFNAKGSASLEVGRPLRIYCSSEAHSSVIKGARIAGFGDENIVQVAVDKDRAMAPDALAQAIETDLAAGRLPCCIVATVGTTSTTAIDPLQKIGPLARKFDLWLHVDAALAGSAAILPEKRWILDGVEHADSLVFNPHKWLFVNFDCSAFFVRDPGHLERVMAIDPAYLQTDRDSQVTNYRDWGIQLGRRFRALKVWFVLRSYGADRLRAMLAEHIAMAVEFRDWIEGDADWELLAPVPLNTVCFRFHPTGFAGADEELNRLNKDLMDRVNAAGRTYLTHTVLDGCFALRLAVGQTGTQRRHVAEAWEELREKAGEAS
ncbi:aspartate aminotransferase family protein [bacterium CG17_big_fil_post_rev_8_21_14_2_50_64_8]|nr:MAG: aspartate aminotransferase family protein [bacterium CG17_big_fil_post_rev_8_21_14_2_50_64_8]PJA76540.1 MAG: aspartate aminotransferase family protein [bacterium CG_4_9_14_3_um_filter_65_15]